MYTTTRSDTFGTEHTLIVMGAITKTDRSFTLDVLLFLGFSHTSSCCTILRTVDAFCPAPDDAFRQTERHKPGRECCVLQNAGRADPRVDEAATFNSSIVTG